MVFFFVCLFHFFIFFGWFFFVQQVWEFDIKPWGEKETPILCNMSRTQSRGGLSLWSFKPLTKSSNSASQRNKQLTQRGVSRLRWFHHRSDLSSSSCLLTCCDLRAFYYWSFQKILPFNYHFKSEVDPFSAVFLAVSCHLYIVTYSLYRSLLCSAPPR